MTSQFLEQPQGAVGQHPTVAVVALDIDDAALLVLEDVNPPALRQHMQDALFVSGNVHLKNPNRSGAQTPSGHCFLRAATGSTICRFRERQVAGRRNRL